VRLHGGAAEGPTTLLLVVVWSSSALLGRRPPAAVSRCCYHYGYHPRSQQAQSCQSCGPLQRSTYHPSWAPPTRPLPFHPHLTSQRLTLFFLTAYPTSTDTLPTTSHRSDGTPRIPFPGGRTFAFALCLRYARSVGHDPSPSNPPPLAVATRLVLTRAVALPSICAAHCPCSASCGRFRVLVGGESRRRLVAKPARGDLVGFSISSSSSSSST
jgi:hypothetical protein